MLSHFPFFRRATRPTVSRPALYLAMLALGGISAFLTSDADGLMMLFMVLVTVFSFVGTMRTVDDDHASGTLEQLDVLPMPRWRMALETAAGTLCAFGWFAAFGVAVGCLGMSRTFGLQLLFNALPIPVAAALLGTLPPLRHGMRRFVFPVYAAVVFYGVMSASPHIAEWMHSASLCAAIVMFPVKLAAIVAAWAGLWTFGQALGGGWSGGDSPHGRRSAMPAVACGCSRGTPDLVNPLLWRELKTGRGWLLLWFVMGFWRVCSGGAGRYEHEAFLDACTSVTFLMIWACVASGMRTSRDRLSGMWADLAYTPISAATVVRSRVAGMMVQAMPLCVGWILTAMLMGDVGFSLEDLAGRVLMAFCLFLGAILAGFCSGLSGRGVVAGIGGVVLLYLMMMVSFVPGWLAGMFFGKGQQSTSFLVVSTVAGATLFYGSMFWGALFGVSKAAEEQRA